MKATNSMFETSPLCFKIYVCVSTSQLKEKSNHTFKRRYTRISKGLLAERFPAHAANVHVRSSLLRWRIEIQQD